MIQRLIFILMVCCLGNIYGIFGGLFSSEQDASQKAIPVEKSVAKVVVNEQSGKLFNRDGIGTAFCVSSEGYYVTCYHTLDLGKNAYIDLCFGEKSYPAELVAKSPKLDIALLKLDPSAERDPDQPLTIMEDPVQLGQEVFILGYPRNDFILDSNATMNHGVVAATQRRINVDNPEQRKIDFLQIDAYASEGFSGSPVLDANSKICGMVVFIYCNKADLWKGATFALPGETIRSFIQANIKE